MSQPPSSKNLNALNCIPLCQHELKPVEAKASPHHGKSPRFQRTSSAVKRVPLGLLGVVEKISAPKRVKKQPRERNDKLSQLEWLAFYAVLLAMAGTVCGAFLFMLD